MLVLPPVSAANLHIRRLVAERRITHIKWGSHLHFDPDEIDGWANRHPRPERGAS
ncbi:MAG: hypothetical protein WA797_10740 [Acidimicrobiales bacterium]